MTGSALEPGDRIERLLRERCVQPVFQPVVELDTGVVVAYEALARGPAELGLTSPGELFAAARAAGRLAEVDWLCREAAVDAARAASFRHPLSLFVNAEPAALGVEAGEHERWRSFADLRCYTEVTERAVAGRPAELLRALEQVREQDWGIALDDIGAGEESLALMPLIRPDVLKLDAGVLVRRAPLHTVRVVHAVLSQAAETGAAVVAEGIETEQDLETAAAYGVLLGQGYLLGRPGPLPAPLEFPPMPVPLVERVVDRSVPPSPFALVNTGARSRRVSRDALHELMRQLVVQAGSLRPPPVLLVCLAQPQLMTDGIRRVLEQVAQRLPLAAVVTARDAAPTVPTVPGVRSVVLDPADPAGYDVDVVVVSPHFAAALVARPAVAGAPADQTSYDSVLTFDRGLAVGAANTLLSRVTAQV